MANPNSTLERLIAEGKVRQDSVSSVDTSIPFFLDLEHFVDGIKNAMKVAYSEWDPLTTRYPVATYTVLQARITGDIDALADVAGLICYNRMRSVAEAHGRNIRLTHFTTRATVNMRSELPTWICSLIQGIGMIRVPDAAADITLIPCVTANTAIHYGRAAGCDPNDIHYHRLLQHLKTLNVPVSTVDLQNTHGSFWPTIEVDTPANGEGSDFIAPFPRGHYLNEDLIFSFISKLGAQVGEVMTFTAERVNHANTLTQLAAAGNPVTLPANATATSAARNVLGVFKVNHFGIKPAIAAAGEAAAVAAETYPIGRSTANRYFATYLARRITDNDINAAMREKLLPPTAH